jgi:glycosyltransferase involved in cell wall biosynthesis
MKAALYFEPDAYTAEPGRVMGRQAASSAFLRAAAQSGGPLTALVPHRSAAEQFQVLVQSLDPTIEARTYLAHDLSGLQELGALHLADPSLPRLARSRLRVGPGNFSITGVTHTTASHSAMDALANLLVAPVMPWDALISTSRAVGQTLAVVAEAELAYLRWRFGSDITVTLPQLPIIPLGIHTGDYAFSVDDRQAARAALGIGVDEMAILYVGRLSQHAKAHPHALYRALETVARRTARKLVLVQCGWFINSAMEESFRSGAALVCPSVRCLYLNGTDEDERRRCWAAADLFVSLADNIQETFGLTPVEAMAAGLPVLVTDWDGYRETVRDEVDGFRVRTTTPAPGLGDHLAAAYDNGAYSYDLYCALSSQLVALDHEALAERLERLVLSSELRLRLGKAGRERAREVYDWGVIFGRYEQLWAELGEIRASSNPEWSANLAAAPRANPARLDPFKAFAHYPSETIHGATIVEATPSAEAYETLIGHPMFSYARDVLPTPQATRRILELCSPPGREITEIASMMGVATGACVLAVSVLAKMGYVQISGSHRFVQSVS